jgi:hypothetical protein
MYGEKKNSLFKIVISIVGFQRPCSFEKLQLYSFKIWRCKWLF